MITTIMKFPTYTCVFWGVPQVEIKSIHPLNMGKVYHIWNPFRPKAKNLKPKRLEI